MLLIKLIKAVSERYFQIWGLLFNGFAILSLFLFITKTTPRDKDLLLATIRNSLFSSQLCTQSLAGLVLNEQNSTDFILQLRNGKPLGARTEMSEFGIQINEFFLDTKQIFPQSKTGEGHLLYRIPARVAYLNLADQTQLQHLVGFVYIETDKDRKIRRCLPSMDTESAKRERLCLSSGGHLNPEGDCLIKVNMPSDCALMSGRLGQNQICQVPKTSPIILSTASQL